MTLTTLQRHCSVSDRFDFLWRTT